ncbi:hypothetical protein [Methylocapsa sp. S129]|uniref:hypothetical protein n=1 Tax=Methylocapsa sp. S129 TaxID=1641869 RepID=UPI00131CED65|nr:hypothetical protein [Methylocapsa sp. S129]
MSAPISEPKPDKLAAHDLLSELRTRIATQPLGYQHGDEARALESLVEVFALARKAMKDHPGCENFARMTTQILNVDLRPVTAKWHRAARAGLLNSKDGANEFRADLARVRQKLVAFSEELQKMAYGNCEPDAVTPPVMPPDEIDHCLGSVAFGIVANSSEKIPNVAEINGAEGAAVDARRVRHKIKTAKGADAVGLALSGGGIRSATFCLGVVQVLAERGLMKDVDFLSTVSGGGYTGSFITARIGQGQDFAAIGSPHGPDTPSVRYLRQNAKYLNAVDLKHRWFMATGTLAGLLLNWTAPLCVIALLALGGDLIASAVSAEMLGYTVPTLAIATLVLTLIYGAALRAGGTTTYIGSWLLAGSAGLTVAALAIFGVERGYLLFHDALRAHWSISSLAAAALIATPALLRYLPIFRSPAIERTVIKVVLAAAAIVVPVLGLICFYLLLDMNSLSPDPSASVWSPMRYAGGVWITIAVAVIAGLFSRFLLNINLTGPHKLYRDQLARTFVQASTEDGDIPLSAANGFNGAPYHLINATINLPSSTSAVLRDRRGDFFLFSKFWTGARSVGYRPTGEWRSNGAEIDLATAMAISGAAASPHMGLESKPTLAALLTFLNIRLGFWIAKPQSNKGVPAFGCLLREMTGVQMSEHNDWLNLSDGGHIENMGIYELLRRRCKFIICVDGEADPQSTFHGQMTLVRHAQIDFGIRIEPRFDDLRPDSKSTFSRSHSQLFRIRYPADGDRPNEIGLMLSLKLSLTGDEAELVKRYRAIHPDFPHQSTLDQFYDEEQFEAYRQLGVHVAEGTFSPALMTVNSSPPSIANWFRQLASNMLEPSGEISQ